MGVEEDRENLLIMFLGGQMAGQVSSRVPGWVLEGVTCADTAVRE